MTSSIKTLDYQDCIRKAALAFLERHQGEHLNDLSALLDRTISHLVSSFNVVEPLATRLASQAHIELLEISFRQRIDLNFSTDTALVIRDPVNGQCWSVPVNVIYERILKAPDNGRYRAAHS
ncbi:hypothetical protein HX882_24530 [Pseudomonas gingeri]|uniref:Prophage PssSM-01 n=1 Tax=Pseudomonas gingeri TaxID=117681 RepID=A0A7Y7XFW2_9PSED|nr:hypothetical protein [Pseudomonas gingeri]NWB99065.1 hypothetical protein [Pseudomonas gingeri]